MPKVKIMDGVLLQSRGADACSSDARNDSRALCAPDEPYVGNTHELSRREWEAYRWRMT